MRKKDNNIVITRLTYKSLVKYLQDAQRILSKCINLGREAKKTEKIEKRVDAILQEFNCREETDIYIRVRNCIVLAYENPKLLSGFVDLCSTVSNPEGVGSRDLNWNIKQVCEGLEWIDPQIVSVYFGNRTRPFNINPKEFVTGIVNYLLLEEKMNKASNITFDQKDLEKLEKLMRYILELTEDVSPVLNFAPTSTNLSNKNICVMESIIYIKLVDSMKMALDILDRGDVSEYVTTSVNLSRRVNDILGTLDGAKGAEYLHRAIMIAYENPELSKMSEIYAMIAEEEGVATSRISREIRSFCRELDEKKIKTIGKYIANCDVTPQELVTAICSYMWKEDETAIKIEQEKWKNLERNLETLLEKILFMRGETSQHLKKIMGVNLEKTVDDMLKDMRVPIQNVGYAYLKEAIIIGFLDRKKTNSISKGICPPISQKFGVDIKTLQNNIQRAVACCQNIETGIYSDFQEITLCDLRGIKPKKFIKAMCVYLDDKYY